MHLTLSSSNSSPMESLHSINRLNPSLPKASLLPCNAQIRSLCSRNRTLHFTVSCKLKSSQVKRKNAKLMPQKILLSEEVPPPLAEGNSNLAGDGREEARKSGTAGGAGFVKRFPRRVLAVLSNLPLAIGEMATIAALMALGTSYNYYRSS